MLPRRLNGVSLATASTSGASIFAEFGGTAWAKQMTKWLASIGKTPAALDYAQVWDPSQTLSLDAGVFGVHDVSAANLQQAIVAASLPDEPGLLTSSATVGSKHVTVLTNSSDGSILYLYEHDGAVFYIGGDDQTLAGQFLNVLP